MLLSFAPCLLAVGGSVEEGACSGKAVSCVCLSLFPWPLLSWGVKTFGSGALWYVAKALILT